MIEAMLLAFLAGKIKKYRLTPLFREWPIYLVFGSILIYLFMNFFISQGNTALLKYATTFKAVFVLIFAIMIVKYSLYKTGFLSVFLVVLGGLMNNLVIKANGGRMPVFPSFSYITGYMKPEIFNNLEKIDSLHIQGSPETRLAFLADWIDLGYTIMSIGDIFFMSFVFLTIYGTIKHLNFKNFKALNVADTARH